VRRRQPYWGGPPGRFEARGRARVESSVTLDQMRYEAALRQSRVYHPGAPFETEHEAYQELLRTGEIPV